MAKTTRPPHGEVFDRLLDAVEGETRIRALSAAWQLVADLVAGGATSNEAALSMFDMGSAHSRLGVTMMFQRQSARTGGRIQGEVGRYVN